jgi:hypothetical protein
MFEIALQRIGLLFIQPPTANSGATVSRPGAGHIATRPESCSANVLRFDQPARGKEFERLFLPHCGHCLEPAAGLSRA